MFGSKRAESIHHFCKWLGEEGGFLELVHADVSIRTHLRAHAAANAPIQDLDFQGGTALDGTDRALRHAKRIAAGTTCRSDKKVIVAKTVSQ